MKNQRVLKRLVTCMVGLPLAGGLLLSDVSEAGFLVSSFGSRTSGSDTYISFPDVISGTGIEQDASPLNPDDWNRYRVRVFHDDATFPNLGWASDSFDPTDETEEIRICQWAGCSASEIYVGTESLDWTDTSKISAELEAKACPTCTWQGFDIPLQ